MGTADHTVDRTANAIASVRAVIVAIGRLPGGALTLHPIDRARRFAPFTFGRAAQ